MKSVMLSVKPYWLFLIIAEKMGWNIGKKKTIEVRKSYPKDTGWNKSVILYCTKDYNSLNKVPKEYRPLMRLMLGKVIGEFVCDQIGAITLCPLGYIFNHFNLDNDCCCLSYQEVDKYLNGKNGYGWHISDLKIYDKPKELSEFSRWCDSCSWPILPFSIPPCEKCPGRALANPPQSWYYVEGLIQ